VEIKIKIKMCGRTACTLEPVDIKNYTKTDTWTNEDLYRPSKNVTPSRYQPVMLSEDNQIILRSMKWGLVPKWSKTPDKPITINTRDDSLVRKSEKPLYKPIKEIKRCIVILEGFFEWQTKGKEKQPYFIHANSEKVIYVAALYEIHDKLYTYTLITTPSDGTIVENLHHRMPVILNNVREDWKKWLDPKVPWDDVEYLVGNQYKDLKYYPVTTKANSGVYFGDDILDPIVIREKKEKTIDNYFKKSPRKKIKTEDNDFEIVE
jgi:putative SOS response-associated peptidase YedK